MMRWPKEVCVWPKEHNSKALFGRHSNHCSGPEGCKCARRHVCDDLRGGSAGREACAAPLLQHHEPGPPAEVEFVPIGAGTWGRWQGSEDRVSLWGWNRDGSGLFCHSLTLLLALHQAVYILPISHPSCDSRHHTWNLQWLSIWY